jgi:hypothetical protein
VPRSGSTNNGCQGVLGQHQRRARIWPDKHRGKARGPPWAAAGAAPGTARPPGCSPPRPPRSRRRRRCSGWRGVPAAPPPRCTPPAGRRRPVPPGSRPGLACARQTTASSHGWVPMLAPPHLLTPAAVAPRVRPTPWPAPPRSRSRPRPRPTSGSVSSRSGL